MMRLVEFGDLSIVPDLYHFYLRQYLVFFYKTFGYYKLWIPEFAKFIRNTNAKKLQDCCSGAGDPIKLIDSQLNKHEFSDVHFLLTDIQPHPEFVKKINESNNTRFHYIKKSIDITKTSREFNYPKIFINSFHHLSPKQVGTILKANIDAGNEIIIMEYVRNSVLGYISMLVGPIVILLTLPFVVTPKHLLVMALFTYLIPLFPLMVAWDGIVSCMHEYSERRLKKIIKTLGVDIKLKSTIVKSLLYPAGVSVTTLARP